MYTRRRVTMVLPLVLIAAACTGDVGETTTTSTTTATTSTSTSVATTTTVEGMPIPEAPPASCFYLDGFIAVEEGQGGVAIAALEDFDVELSLVSAAEVLGDSEAVEPLDGAIDLISTSVDSLDVATALVAAQITAGPIYAVGQAGHWRLKPGTDPISRPGAQIPIPNADLGEGVIAVVDSGILIENLPEWMSPEHVLYDRALDTETIGTEANVASHGTFVSSLIRQLAPEHRVAFASAKPVLPDMIVQNEDELPPDVTYISTELHVAEAMVRLTQRRELDDGNLAALNLSLGTYTCNPGQDPTMVTTMAAMRLWFAAFPNSTVFAAGGNEADEAPFWPAGLSTFQLDPAIDTAWVRGVGAVNEAVDQVIWSSTAAAGAVAPQLAPQRDWVTDVAPGCDLLGLRGGVDVDGAGVVAWSGSSFATAVSAAMDAAEVPPTSVGPPVEYDYSVPNLLFERLGSCDLP